MDGWGFAFLNDGKLEVIKSGKDAISDPQFERTAKQIAGHGIIIGHIRKSSSANTRGKIEFAHPFLKGVWAFAHNGEVRFPLEWKTRYPNMIDSQIVLEVLLTRINSAPNFRAGIVQGITDIMENHEISSLNFLLTNGENIITYRAFSGNDPENAGYYTLFKKVEQDRVLIASEPLDENIDAWTLLANGELLIVDQNLNIETEMLEPHGLIPSRRR
jgi:predicted glutamine amidotransferase